MPQLTDCWEEKVEESTEDMHACFEDAKLTVTPVDPNEKVVVPRKFVRPSEALLYPIHFENIGDVEARDVFVKDVLDSKLDVTTLSILTPNGASFDPITRTVSWRLLGRNLLPHETGNLLLSVRPVLGLASGTEIRNKARIQFEIFEPLDTNEVVNVIDSTRPTCTVSPLPARTSTPSFPLFWSGIDEVGEIESYSVLVSVDGGSFVPLLERVQATNTVFTGELGKRYSFLCIAADTAGNVEIQDAVGETSTLVQLDITPPTITVSASPAKLWPPNGRIVPVTIAGRMTDAEVGIDASTAAYKVTDEYGKFEQSGIINLSSSGSYSFTISLQASRDGSDRDGRRYNITITSQDNVGNAGSAFVVVTVPHDRP